MRWVVLVLWLAVPTAVRAHPLAPSLLELHERYDGGLDVEWRVPALAVPGLRATPVLPAACRDASAHETSSDGARIDTRWRVACDGPLVGGRVGVRDVGPAGAVVRVVFRDGRVAQRL